MQTEVKYIVCHGLSGLDTSMQEINVYSKVPPFPASTLYYTAN